MEDVVKFLDEKEKSKRTIKDFLLDLFDIIAFLVFVGGIVLFIRFFLFNPYTVVGQSMEPTFDEKDFIIVDKVTPRINKGYQRGDIVVFVPPGKDVPYIKRIVGLPGEKIKVKEGTVFVCKTSSAGEACTQLDEKYLPDGAKTLTTCGIDEFKVTDNNYLVFGDNRNHSTDSRCCFGFGCYSGSNYLLPNEYIIGKVSLRIFPSFNKF